MIHRIVTLVTNALLNHPEDHVGCTFFIPKEDGQNHQAQIVKCIIDHEHALDTTLNLL